MSDRETGLDPSESSWMSGGRPRPKRVNKETPPEGEAKKGGNVHLKGPVISRKRRPSSAKGRASVRDMKHPPYRDEAS